MKRILILAMGLLASCAAWKLHTMVHAQSTPSVSSVTLPTWPDVFTPGTASMTANSSWALQVQGNENSLAQQGNGNAAAIQDLQNRVKALEAKVNGSAPIPPAPISFSIPVTQATIAGGPTVPVCGAIICNTLAGEILTFPVSLPAGAYTLSVTGAGPGTLGVLINGNDAGVLMNFPMTQTQISAKITWPGGSGTIGLLYHSAWINLSSNVTIQ